MNNKGFTLIELIAIIIIVSVIMILSFSSLTNTLKRTQLKEIEDYKLKVATAAQIYVETDLMRYEPFNSGTHIDITIEELVNKGYLRNDIEVPGKCTFDNTTIVATKNIDNTISYDVSCEESGS